MSTSTNAAEVVEAALAELDGLEEAPLDECLGRLGQACDTLSQVLDSSTENIQISIPGLPSEA